MKKTATMTNPNAALYEYIKEQARETQINGVKIASVPVALLYVEAEYQRGITSARWKKIRNMAENWNALKAGALIVADRPDDKCFAVIDGQGRKLAAEMAGIKNVTCMIAENLSIAEEAALYVEQNKNVTPLRPYDKYVAYLAAQDESNPRSVAAMKLRDICADFGVTVKANCAPKETGVLRCLATALEICENDPKILEWIFNIIKECGWAASPNAYSEANIIAFRNVYKAHSTAAKHSAKVFVRCLVAMGYDSETFGKKARAKFFDCSASVAINKAFELILLYNCGEIDAGEYPYLG